MERAHAAQAAALALMSQSGQPPVVPHADAMADAAANPIQEVVPSGRTTPAPSNSGDKSEAVAEAAQDQLHASACDSVADEAAHSMAPADRESSQVQLL